jgi:hypothetical protein
MTPQTVGQHADIRIIQTGEQATRLVDAIVEHVETSIGTKRLDDTTVRVHFATSWPSVGAGSIRKLAQRLDPDYRARRELRELVDCVALTLGVEGHSHAERRSAGLDLDGVARGYSESSFRSLVSAASAAARSSPANESPKRPITSLTTTAASCGRSSRPRASALSTSALATRSRSRGRLRRLPRRRPRHRSATAVAGWRLATATRVSALPTPTRRPDLLDPSATRTRRGQAAGAASVGAKETRAASSPPRVFDRRNG